MFLAAPDESSGEDTDAQDFDYESSASKSSEVKREGQKRGCRRGRRGGS